MFKIIERLVQWLEKPQNQTPKTVTVKASTVEKFEEKQKTVSTPPSSSFEDTSDLEILKEQYRQESQNTLQEKLNSLPTKSILELWPKGGEYAGPIKIDRSLQLDGQDATFWSLHGPVLVIESDEVSLSNLRIEVTGEESKSREEQCAIFVKNGKKIQFNNVEVRGLVMGLPEEEGEWKYPETLNLGKLNYGQEYRFLLRIVTPTECKIASSISGVTFEPTQLNSGYHEICLHIDQMPKDTLLNGAIFLISASFKRRIPLTAHIQSLTNHQLEVSEDSVIWEPSDWSNSLPVSSEDESFSEAEYTDSDVVTFTNLTVTESSEETQESSADPKLPIYEPDKEFLSKRQIKVRKGEPYDHTLFQSQRNQSSQKVDQTQKIEPSQPPKLFTQSQKNQNLPSSEPKIESDSESSELPSIFSQQKSEPTESPSSEETSSNSSDIHSSKPTARSRTVNPLFQQKQTSTADSEHQEPSINQTNANSSDQSDKRKVVHDKKISPLFKNSAKNNSIKRKTE